jgi:hypothetical protein
MFRTVKPKPLDYGTPPERRPTPPEIWFVFGVAVLVVANCFWGIFGL